MGGRREGLRDGDQSIRTASLGRLGVSFPHPMSSRENVRGNLELIFPTLKEKWNEWREFYAAR